MHAGRGMVALHDSATSTMGGQPGLTELVFVAEDVDELQGTLQSAGYSDLSIWDEAYGRVLSATGPGRTKVWIDEHHKDPYGYRLTDARPDDRWTVTPTLTGVDQPSWEQILDQFGTRQRVYFGSGATYGVRLDLSTTEALDDVQRRLVAAEYDVSGTDAGLEIVDPDGQPVVIHG